MFKLSPNSSFWAKVPLSVPGAEKQTVIELEFKYLPKTAINTFLHSLEGKKDEEALLEIVLNWKGVDSEFSRENFSALINNYPASALEIFAAYRKETLEAKTKN